jgi:flavin reductase (DIM6/NTAB) family NADH-FMN oxidoreductase RutF
MTEGTWFTVNILSATQEALSRRFAKLDAEMRFDGIGFSRGTHGTAVLDDVLAHLECCVLTTYDGGDHLIIVGSVEQASTTEDRPLLYYRGGYAQLER